jgi:hypothetical protein
MTEGISERSKFMRNSDKILQISAIVGIIVGTAGIVSAVCAVFVSIYITPLEARVFNHVGKDEEIGRVNQIRISVLETKFDEIQSSLLKIEKILEKDHGG